MPQDIQRPFDFQDGTYVSAEELHNYLEQATILPGFIGDKGAETVIAPNDEMIFNDVSHNRLRKITYQNLAAAGGLDPRSNSHTVLQNNHNFAVGDVLYWAGTQYKKAKAEDSAAKVWIGIVRSVTDANTFVMVTSGFINGLSGLLSPTTYYLSPDTAGAFTSTAPTGLTPVVPVMIAMSATEAYLLGTHQAEPQLFITGDLKLTVRTTALPGWLMCNGQTIGPALSAAHHQGDAYKELFKLIWAATAAKPENAQILNSGGAPVDRGTDADEDWEALRRLPLPDPRQRGISIAGNKDGLTERKLLDAYGAEQVTLETTQMPEAGITLPVYNANGQGGGGGFPRLAYVLNGEGDYSVAEHTFEGGEESGEPVDILGPSMAFNLMIKT